MKRSLLALLLLAVVPTFAFAQGFNAVFSQDGQEVWAVGDGGLVYRSITSGGEMWEQSLGTAPLRGVWASDLQVVVIADQGQIWRSVDYGNTWSMIPLAGAPNLRGLEMPSPTIGYVVGASGRIAKSTDGGASWTFLNSGTTVMLEAVSFTDISNGWAVGGSGTVLKTTNGGGSWTPVAVGTTARLRAVDASGSTVWIGGDGAVCIKSTNSGASWQPVNLKLENRADITSVRVLSTNEAYVAGGGGFVRHTTDGGSTWTFGIHDGHGQISSLWAVGTRAWFVSSRHRMVYRTSNSGATWQRPVGSSLSRSMVQRMVNGGTTWPGTVRGNTLTMNPFDRKTLYTVMCGNSASASYCSVYVSRDDGNTWWGHRALPTESFACNAFLVSPADSNKWLAAAVVNGNDGVIRSTDGGTSWTMTMTREFGTFGIPLEMHPDKPDTVYFGGEEYLSSARLWRSTNFGSSWSAWSNDSLFRSPCDLVVVPDSSNIIIVGDGETGVSNPGPMYYRSTNGGQTFALMSDRTGLGGSPSEIPGLSNSRLRNNVTFGTNWSSGGVQRSTDYGATWTNVLNSGGAGDANSMWGTDVCKEDPYLVACGQFGNAGTYLSTNGGDNFIRYQTPGIGSNYSFLLRDRETVLAEHGTGIWKMQFSYAYTPATAQSLFLSSPIGGETWQAGSVHNIVFSDQNVMLVRIEWRTAADQPWQLIAERPGSTGTYAWTVPYVSTYEAEVRVRDAWDLDPEDTSDGPFTIVLPLASATPASLDFGSHNKGSVTVLPVTLENTGSAILLISSVTTTGAGFTEGRNVFSVFEGSSDTIGVAFRPAGAGVYSGTLQILSNAYGQPTISIPLTGIGVAPVFTAFPNPLDLGEWNPGATAKDTIRIENHGNTPLSVTNITTSHPEFWPGRTSLSIPPGGSDTVRIFYRPLAPGADTATVSVFASDTAAAHLLKVYGEGRANVDVASDPIAFGVWQNRPNPFRNVTEIRYALPQEVDVLLEVFDLQGHRVTTLVNARQGPGNYSVPFGSRINSRPGTLPAGVYFYSIKAGSFRATRKMLMLQ